VRRLQVRDGPSKAGRADSRSLAARVRSRRAIRPSYHRICLEDSQAMPAKNQTEVVASKFDGQICSLPFGAYAGLSNTR